MKCAVYDHRNCSRNSL